MVKPILALHSSPERTETRGEQRRFRLYIPLYLSFAIALMFGGSLVSFYEQYAATDFGEIVRFVESNRELFGGFDYENEAEWERRGREVERRVDGELINDFEKPDHDERFGSILVLSWVVLVVWLWPVYRRDRRRPISKTVQQRVLHLPRLVLALPWVFGAIDALQKIFGGPGRPGEATGSSVIFIASFLIFGALVSQFNVSITLPYITRRIADDVFQGHDRYAPKQGRTITISGRIQLLILTVAMLPIVLSILTPVLFNWWVIEAAKTSGEPDFVQIARVFAPIAVMVMIGVYFIFAQIIALISFRKAVQRPIDTLVKRMQAVSRGDFSTRSSVLSVDEIGALKGHFNTMVEGLEEREKIRDTFGRYVSMEIAEKLMTGGTVDLAGEEIVTTVMFADIRSFTALSETMTPRELVTFLNEYFSYIVKPITEQSGVVNKFIGDSVMAVFSPVFGVEDHAEAAVRAGLGMRGALKTFNEVGRYPPIRQGIGIHTGVLIAGTVGAEDRREYTVIGDTVNVASRIESQTKVLGTDILVSGDAVDQLSKSVRNELGLTETEAVTMRGKSTPTRLFLCESEEE